MDKECQPIERLVSIIVDREHYNFTIDIFIVKLFDKIRFFSLTENPKKQGPINCDEKLFRESIPELWVFQ